MTPNHGKLHATTFETYCNITNQDNGKKKERREIALVSPANAITNSLLNS